MYSGTNAHSSMRSSGLVLVRTFFNFLFSECVYSYLNSSKAVCEGMSYSSTPVHCHRNTTVLVSFFTTTLGTTT